MSPPQREANQARIMKKRNIPEEGGGNFAQDPAGGTVRVAREGDTTKLGYLTFGSGIMYTINWNPTGGSG